MRYIILTAFLFIVGCGPPEPPPTPAQIEEKLQEFGNEEFPNGAKKVMDLGNGWKTFEIEIDGTNHKFLYRKSDYSFGDNSWARESITEISPASLP